MESLNSKEADNAMLEEKVSTIEKAMEDQDLVNQFLADNTKECEELQARLKKNADMVHERDHHRLAKKCLFNFLNFSFIFLFHRNFQSHFQGNPTRK